MFPEVAELCKCKRLVGAVVPNAANPLLRILKLFAEACAAAPKPKTLFSATMYALVSLSATLSLALLVLDFTVNPTSAPPSELNVTNLV